jgi:elongation factor Tu
MATAIALFCVPAAAPADDDFSMQVMDAFTVSGQGTVVTGQISTGAVSLGDTVCVPLKNGETVARPVKGIEMFRKLLERAEAGQTVGLLVDVDSKQVEKGTTLHADCVLDQ